jgi:CBS domain-containing protein
MCKTKRCMVVKPVREVMVPEPLTVSSTASIIEAARSMRAWDVSGVFVVDDDDRFVGDLRARDVAVIAIAAGRHPRGLGAGECCDPTTPRVHVDESIDRAVALVEHHDADRLPVVDDDGLLMGTVWAADLIPAWLRSPLHRAV